MEVEVERGVREGEEPVVLLRAREEREGGGREEVDECLRLVLLPLGVVCFSNIESVLKKNNYY